ncbi:MAG: hypothetical protein AAGK37_04945 [Pseudomonadota bacterium]
MSGRKVKLDASTQPDREFHRDVDPANLANWWKSHMESNVGTENLKRDLSLIRFNLDEDGRNDSLQFEQWLEKELAKPKSLSFAENFRRRRLETLIVRRRTVSLPPQRFIAHLNASEEARSAELEDRTARLAFFERHLPKAAFTSIAQPCLADLYYEIDQIEGERQSHARKALLRSFYLNIVRALIAFAYHSVVNRLTKGVTKRKP